MGLKEETSFGETVTFCLVIAFGSEKMELQSKYLAKLRHKVPFAMSQRELMRLRLVATSRHSKTIVFLPFQNMEVPTRFISIFLKTLMKATSL